MILLDLRLNPAPDGLHSRVMFPDNQPHLRVSPSVEDEEVSVIAPIRSALELFEVMLLNEFLTEHNASKKTLVIPYLMGARSDRRMTPPDAFALRVVAKEINSWGFERVKLVDVHSDVSTALISRSSNYGQDTIAKLITRYHPGFFSPGTVLVCPDAGAVKRVGAIKTAFPETFTEVAHCAKTRDPGTGRLKLKVLDPESVRNKHCVVFDDLCDGGGTFLAIAEQLRPVGPESLTLVVTHAIFSQGLSVLEKAYDRIVCTNSFRQHTSGRNLTVIQLFPNGDLSI